MMTDGVADYFKEEQKKELFAKMLGSKGYSDPTVLANYIMNKALQLSAGDPAGRFSKETHNYIRDDMTVLVLKIDRVAACLLRINRF